MVARPTDSIATSDLGSPEAGGTRRLLLDEMLAERARPPLPPAPVLTVEPVAVDAAPIGGRRGARKRLAEVEALARRNLRAAEEARRYVHEERQLLEEEASARTQAERTAAGLRREIERLRSTEEQRAAQARYAATHEARSELATEIERVQGEHARVVDELDRMRGTLFDHDSLLDEYSRRLRDEQDAQTKAHSEQIRAEEAQRVAERNLEIATETARRRSEDDLARFQKVEEAWRNVVAERDRVTAELHAITNGDGELVRLRSEIEATREDMTRLLADLDVQAARADTAETELATATEARASAEKAATEAIEARDLLGIALETMRSELAEKSEALDAERSTSQGRIADLVAQLATATRTAESATERSADLEARLDGAIAARDDALSRAEALTDQLTRAQADTEQLRTHSASIGDELAATQATLETTRQEAKAAVQATREKAKAAVQAARDEARAALQAATPMPAGAVVEHVELALVPAPELRDPLPEPADPPASTFDAALASAFGQEPAPAMVEPAPDAVEPAASVEPAPAPVEIGPERPAKPVTKFRIAEPDRSVRKRRAGGPVVDLELSLARGIEPVDAALDMDAEVTEPEPAKPPARSPETETWRRTAMAELTALATDSDDLTPRRRH